MHELFKIFPEIESISNRIKRLHLRQIFIEKNNRINRLFLE